MITQDVLGMDHYQKFARDGQGKIRIVVKPAPRDSGLSEEEILKNIATNPTAVLQLACSSTVAREKIKEWGFSSGLPLKEPYTLRDYQLDTIKWMIKTERIGTFGIRGGIINLEMGLGKSLVAMGHTLLTKTKNDFPTLIIASKTVMFEWKSEGVEKFFGDDVKVLFLHECIEGKSNIVNLDREAILKYDFVITTYDVCRMESERGKHYEKLQMMGTHPLHQHHISYYRNITDVDVDDPKAKGVSVIFKTPWKIVVCDESQEFANPKTKLFRAILSIYGKYKWCLSGTPVVNYNEDMWSQLRFLGYDTVVRPQEWSYQKFQDQNLGIFIITMKGDLPPKIRDKSNIRMYGNQKKLYEYIASATRETFEKSMNKLVSYANVLSLFSRLRQCCIAPYLMTSESKRKNSGADQEVSKFIKEITDNLDVGEWIHNKMGTAGINSSKITRLIEILTEVPRTDKVLIFSMFTSCLDLIALAIKTHLPDLKFEFCDGDVKGLTRRDVIENFKNPHSGVNILLLTYKTGSTGLNLTVANRVICAEPWWTFAVTDQAESRSWRMGQTKSVIVHEIIVENSIEIDIQKLCEEKRELAKAYLAPTSTSTAPKLGLDRITMRRLLRI